MHHPPTKLTILPTHPEYHMCDTVLRHHSARCTGVFLRWVRDRWADLVGRSPQTCRSRGHRPPFIPAPTKKLALTSPPPFSGNLLILQNASGKLRLRLVCPVSIRHDLGERRSQRPSRTAVAGDPAMILRVHSAKINMSSANPKSKSSKPSPKSSPNAVPSTTPFHSDIA